MNNWMRLQLQEILLNRTTLKEDHIEDLVESFGEFLEARRYAIVPKFLSDEMYDAIKEQNPILGFNAASNIYISSVNGYLKAT